MLPVHFLCYAAPRVERLVLGLGQAGLLAYSLPFQTIHTTVEQATSARQCLRTLVNFDCVVFTSPNAVEAVAPFVQELPELIGQLSLPTMYAVGAGTAAALAQHFPYFVVKTPDDGADADAVEQAILRATTPDQRNHLKLAVVRGQVGREDWLDRLGQHGVSVTIFAVYEATDGAPSSEALARFRTALEQLATYHQPMSVVMSSVHNVALFFAWAHESALAPALLHKVHWFAIHPKIKKELDQRGYSHTRLIAPGNQSLLDALK